MPSRKVNRKVDATKWYLVDTITNRLPTLLRKEFDTKKDAIRFIENKLNGDLVWDYLPGSEVIEMGLRFKMKGPRLGVQVIKYEYPPELLSQQERKNFRTKFRRDGKKEN